VSTGRPPYHAIKAFLTAVPPAASARVDQSPARRRQRVAKVILEKGASTNARTHTYLVQGSTFSDFVQSARFVDWYCHGYAYTRHWRRRGWGCCCVFQGVGHHLLRHANVIRRRRKSKHAVVILSSTVMGTVRWRSGLSGRCRQGVDANVFDELWQ
jgi:hypothetical protein